MLLVTDELLRRMQCAAGARHSPKLVYAILVIRPKSLNDVNALVDSKWTKQNIPVSCNRSSEQRSTDETAKYHEAQPAHVSS